MDATRAVHARRPPGGSTEEGVLLTASAPAPALPNDGRARRLFAAVREVSGLLPPAADAARHGPALERAASGAAALAVLLTPRDSPANAAAALRGAAAALPAGRPALPLAVLVDGAPDMAEGIAAWAAKLVAGGALGGGVGAWRVARVVDAAGVPDAALLRDALAWLAARAPPAPALEASSLYELAAAALEPALAALAADPGAPPAAWAAALRGALAGAAGRVAAAAASPAAAWRWPPPECCLPGPGGGGPGAKAGAAPARAAFPAAWHAPAAVAAAEAALRRAELPEPPDGDEWRCWARAASEAEWQAVATRHLAAHVDVPGLPPSAAVPWRRRMHHALHARIAALRAAPGAPGQAPAAPDQAVVVAPLPAGPRRVPGAAWMGADLAAGGAPPSAARTWAQVARGRGSEDPGARPRANGLATAAPAQEARAGPEAAAGKRKWAGDAGGRTPARDWGKAAAGAAAGVLRALASAGAPRSDLSARPPHANGSCASAGPHGEGRPGGAALAAALAAERRSGGLLTARMAREADDAGGGWGAPAAQLEDGLDMAGAGADPDPEVAPSMRFDLEQRLRDAREAAQRLTARMQASADSC
jgi:hypothetical protein